MLLAYEPMGELAAPDAQGVTFLGIQATGLARWPSLRHVFDLGEDAGLHVEVGPNGALRAFAVGYDFSGDELLTPL